MSDDTASMEELIEAGVPTAAKPVGQPAAAQDPAVMGQAAPTDKNTQDFLKQLYGPSPQQKTPGSQAVRIAQKAGMQPGQMPQTKEEQDRLAKARQAVSAHDSLHKTSYYDPTFNPADRPEEEVAEKLDREKQEEEAKKMEALQEEEKKKEIPAILQAQNIEKHRGSAG